MSASPKFASNWTDFRASYVRWLHNELYDPLFEDVEFMEHVAPNYIYNDLILGDIEEGVRRMKELREFIERKKFVCEDPRAMEYLATAIAAASEDKIEEAISNMRKFNAGIILALKQPNDEAFAKFRVCVLEGAERRRKWEERNAALAKAQAEAEQAAGAGGGADAGADEPLASAELRREWEELPTLFADGGSRW